MNPVSRKSKYQVARISSGRLVLVTMVALLLCAEIARLTVAAAVAETNLSLANKLAPRSPPVLVSTAMAGVGNAAAVGRNPGKDTFDRLRMLAAGAPLNPEPFLVEAAIAVKNGDLGRAETLLREARTRDPRSAAARYLLADVWFRQDQVVQGLREMAILTRLLPAASMQLMPALSAYAQTPGARDKLTTILAENPQLKNPLLSALAADPDNANLIVALAGPLPRSPDLDTKAWQSRLLTQLVNRGDYARAYELWRYFARLPEGKASLVFNGNFRAVAAPPPFNWSFSASPVGVAEPGQQRLRVLYFGRANATLASQLLLLEPGSYRFTAPFSGTLMRGALSWSLTCLGSRSPLMALRLSPGSPPSAMFTVPSSCRAQQLELKGNMQEKPEDSDVRIGPAQIQRAAP